MRCSDYKTAKLHKCEVESCSSNPVCNNCINPDDMSPRNITSDLTCMKSYILPESKDQIRTVKDYISCKTDAISYVCAGPCKSFKYCRNCVP
uniref:Uncharacterized protein n=1 Tax=Phakopsora pachyrhizi TaxID=170000 RepID=A0A0S1MJC6_PHAPC